MKARTGVHTQLLSLLFYFALGFRVVTFSRMLMGVRWNFQRLFQGSTEFSFFFPFTAVLAVSP